MSAGSTSVTTEEWKPKTNHWVIAVSVILPTFMVILDATVSTVSMPYIAGGLGASLTESTWVLTSFLIANAIVLPCSGWLSRYFGRKRYYLMSIVIFTAASCACGLSDSLPFLILMRIIQGAGGGGLMPLSQAILIESFPKDKRGLATAIFAVGVVVAPIVGPTLGGWLTDAYSWRWTYYINLPAGILSFYLIRLFIEDPPYFKKIKMRLDWIGLTLLIVWMTTFQAVLSKGQDDDWFSAQWIRYFTGTAIVTFIAFIIWEWRNKDPLVNLRIFRDRNFAMGILMITVTGAVIYAAIVSYPLYLQSLMGYTAFLAGWTMAPKGVGSLVMAGFLGKIVQVVDNRILVAIGFLMMWLSVLWLEQIDLSLSMFSLIGAITLNGVAAVTIFVPLSGITMGRLQGEDVGNATGLFSMMLNLGGAIGIAASTTIVQRSVQAYQYQLVHNTSPLNPQFQLRIAELMEYLSTKVNETLVEPMAQTILYNELVQQSALLAYINSFRWVGFSALVVLPGIFLFRKVASTKPSDTPLG